MPERPTALPEDVRGRIAALLTALIDQKAARVVVEPYDRAPGFWFGGGNLIEDADGTIYVSGRYRNYGDSRTGLGKGERGLECAIFASGDRGRSFEKVRSWTKRDLSQAGAEIVSIEGTALHRRADGTLEFFISTEKNVAYPEAFAAYRKPGTGVWSIDVAEAPTVDALRPEAMQPALIERPAPGYLHVKDPWVFDTADGSTVLGFCTHPMAWSSANSAYALRPAGDARFRVEAWEMVSRGPVWDVAATRLTDRLALPARGALQGLEPLAAYFYDAAECLRPLDENPLAAKRPRGYSCEELGGAFLGFDQRFPDMERLSANAPLFVSPHGTGCSRYVATLPLKEGILATWQQAQPDGSQPLVAHLLTNDRIDQILGA